MSRATMVAARGLQALCPQQSRRGQQGGRTPVRTTLNSGAARWVVSGTQVVCETAKICRSVCRSSWWYLPWLIGTISKFFGICFHAAQVSMTSSLQKDVTTLELCAGRRTQCAPEVPLLLCSFSPKILMSPSGIQPWSGLSLSSAGLCPHVGQSTD